MRNSKILLQGVSLLLLMALISSGCNVGLIDLSATQTAVAGTALAQKAIQTAEAEAVATTIARSLDAAVGTAVAATLTAQPTQDVEATVEAAIATQKAHVALTDTPTPTNTPPLTSTVALISCHGLYVTSMDDGTLQQKRDLDDCGRFTLQRLDDGKVALKTCHKQYVTAPMTATTYSGWVVTQSPDLSDCGRFVLHDLGDVRVAFGTCAGRYLTAVSDEGEPSVEWYVIAHTYVLDAWETFTMVQQ